MSDKAVWNEPKPWEGIVDIPDIIKGIADRYGAEPGMVREIFWVAFASYIDREKRRHKKDIIQIDGDLEALAEKGFKPEHIPTELWIAVP